MLEKIKFRFFSYIQPLHGYYRVSIFLRSHFIKNRIVTRPQHVELFKNFDIFFSWPTDNAITTHIPTVQFVFKKIRDIFQRVTFEEIIVALNQVEKLYARKERNPINLNFLFRYLSLSLILNSFILSLSVFLYLYLSIHQYISVSLSLLLDQFGIKLFINKSIFIYLSIYLCLSISLLKYKYMHAWNWFN